MMDVEKFKTATYSGLTEGDWSDFDWWMATESTITYKEHLPEEYTLDDSLFRFIVELMSNEEFHNHKNFYKILVVVEQNWGIMSSEQKADLLIAITAILDRSTQYMTIFCAMEIVGEYFGNFPALSLLNELRASGSVAVRSLLPFGYRTLAKEANDDRLKSDAYDNLVMMQEDKSKIVRDEVAKQLSMWSPHQT